MDSIVKLPEAVAKKYTCTHGTGKLITSVALGMQEIDLTTITVKKADELVKNGFPYLVLKDKSKNSTATSKS